MNILYIKIFFLSVIFLVSGFSFLQCNSSNKEEVKAPGVYFPLKEGLKWTYINEAPREETELITVTCTKNTAIGEFELDKFPFFANLNSSDTKTNISADDSGNVYIKNSSMTSASLLVPAGSLISAGYTWKYNDLLNASLTSKPEKVKTEAGEYECIYIIFTEGFTFSFEMWLAKGKGIVKWGANRTNPPKPFLTYYVLKEISE